MYSNFGKGGNYLYLYSHGFSLEKLREEGTDEDAPSEYPADDCSEKTGKFLFVLGSKDQGHVDGCRHWYCQSLIANLNLFILTEEFLLSKVFIELK